MKPDRCFAIALLLLLLGSVTSVSAQDSALTNLKSVMVIVLWPGGPPAVVDAIQTDIELKLRQAGMGVATPSEDAPRLSIRTVQRGQAIPVDIELREPVYLAREATPRMKETALGAYIQVYEEARAKGIPVTNADLSELLAQVDAERKGTAALPLPPLRDAATWQRHGLAPPSDKPEAVPSSIIARYKAEIFDERMTPPADRPIKERMMELQVQAAIANCQRPVTVTMVRETIGGYIDEFLSEWLAANPRAVR